MTKNLLAINQYLANLGKPVPNRKIKIVNCCLIATCALIPWNATAVNHNGLLSRHQLSAESLTSRIHRLEADGASSNNTEDMLVQSLFEITQGNNKQALETIDQLINLTPNFKLAYLIRGDLLMAQARELQGFGDAGTEKSLDKLAGLKDEARVRIEHYLSEKIAHQQPNLLIQPDASQRYAIVVDADKSRLYVYKNDHGNLGYVSDYYVTIGKNGPGKETSGDKRTPIGVYFASTKLKTPLPDYYGEAAYPLNYPNELDQHLSKSGSGIWLHGTPADTYSRPPRASDGCVVLSKPDLKALEPILKAGNTPVIIVNSLSLSEENNDYEQQKIALTNAMDAWRKDWSAQDTNQYLSHYSKEFFSPEGNYKTWADYKTRVQASKPKVNVVISNISMFSYPVSMTSLPKALQKVVVVDFDQDFRSNNIQIKTRKRQYWGFENNTWKIIYEGKV